MRSTSNYHAFRMVSHALQTGVAILLLSTASAAGQQRIPSEKEICRDLDSLQREMKTLVLHITSSYRTDSLFLQRFNAAQKAWEHYVEAQIAMTFSAVNTFESYGAMYPLCICLERIDVTRKRIAELRPWVDKTAGRAGCPGSTLIDP